MSIIPDQVTRSLAALVEHISTASYRCSRTGLRLDGNVPVFAVAEAVLSSSLTQQTNSCDGANGDYRPPEEWCEIHAVKMDDAGFKDTARVLWEADSAIRGLRAELAGADSKEERP